MRAEGRLAMRHFGRVRMLLGVMAAVAGCGGELSDPATSGGALGKSDNAAARDRACPGLERAITSAAAAALPSLASELLDAHCPTEPACTYLLQTALPGGDSPGLSSAIALLECLADVGDDFVGSGALP